jgi:hypothetical protein
MTTKELKALWDSRENIRAKRDGSFVVKQGFFYRCGGSEDKLARKVETVYSGVGTVTILKAEEHWNVWPKHSWWEVQFKVEVA